ncbi:hypothetical protein CATMIT_01999 [Catenibacterium mitsuokai DSM 15897]|nr:hypothetical protein CATMIT_01999 [Catenibacterium mitsuokai DSM 15897]
MVFLASRVRRRPRAKPQKTTGRPRTLAAGPFAHRRRRSGLRAGAAGDFEPAVAAAPGLAAAVAGPVDVADQIAAGVEPFFELLGAVGWRVGDAGAGDRQAGDQRGRGQNALDAHANSLF